MKRILLTVVLAALGCGGLYANVQALYWQVTADSNPDGIEFQVAGLGVTSDGGKTVTYLDDWVQSSTSGTSTELAATTLGSDYTSSGWSFFIELQNYNTDTTGWYTVGRSDYVSYSDVQSKIVKTANFGTLSSSIQVFAPTVHVPEPTSGVLLILGGALLALRRKRA